MTDGPLTLAWRQESEQDDYWYGVTLGRFSAQIGKSTNAGLYLWMIFHEDFRYVVHGEEVSSVIEAQSQAQSWLLSNAKSPSDEPGVRPA